MDNLGVFTIAGIVPEFAIYPDTKVSDASRPLNSATFLSSKP